MKRSNPQTGKIFKCGEYRDDGFRFHHYRYDRPLKDGLYTEAWYSPEAYENQIIGMAKCRESNREKARQTTRVWQINNPDPRQVKASESFPKDHAPPKVRPMSIAGLTTGVDGR